MTGREGTMKGIGIYLRLSEVRPGEDAVSLKTQEADCRTFAKRKGWAVAEVYRDAGRSAWSDTRDRPAFDRMLGDLDAGRVTGILAWKQDRLGRRVAEVAALLDRARQLGAVVATVADGLDTTTSNGRMAAQMVAAVAENESANTSIRVRRAMQARAERGDAHGGPRPYGYRREGGLVVDPAEAVVIKECAARVLAGETIGRLLRDLQDRGLRTSTGKRWARRSLVNTLTSSRIAGLRQYDGREIPGSWSPIVDRETHDALRAALAPSKVRRPAARSYYLSGGLLVCGRCGSRMKGRAWTDSDGRVVRRAQYACGGAQEHNGCGGIAIAAVPLDDWIGSLVIARLASPAFRRRLEASATDPGVDDLYRRLKKLDATADDLASAFGAGELTRHAHKLAAERNAAERRAVERELRARVGERTTVLTDAPSTEAALVAWWESASVSHRHALAAAVIEAITVSPAIRGRKKFDPDRLDITWTTPTGSGKGKRPRGLTMGITSA
jgi:DNA invertase Pin-like site-specific DNA recombinase